MTEENQDRGDVVGTSRLEAFSDSVMAVIMTIMAFELKAPAGFSFSSLTHRLPALLVYILSFTSIGIYWNNHHHLLRATRQISGAVMWANLYLLFWLSLIPVTTEWVANQYSHEWPAAIYGVVSIGAAISYSLLVRTIIRANPSDSLVAMAIGSDLKGFVSLAAYAAGICLAFVNSYVAYGFYVGVAAIWFVPDRRIVRRVRP